LVWFRAPSLIGGDGLAAIAGFGVDRLVQSPRFIMTNQRVAGDDIFENYERART